MREEGSGGMKPIWDYIDGPRDLGKIHKLGLRLCRIVEPSIEANFDAIALKCFGDLD